MRQSVCCVWEREERSISHSFFRGRTFTKTNKPFLTHTKESRKKWRAVFTLIKQKTPGKRRSRIKKTSDSVCDYFANGTPTYRHRPKGSSEGVAHEITACCTPAKPTAAMRKVTRKSTSEREKEKEPGSRGGVCWRICAWEQTSPPHTNYIH